MTRVRSTTYYDETQNHYWQPRDRDGNPLGAPLNFPARRWRTKVISDVLTPGYFEKLRKGDFLPINPVTITTSTLEQVASSGSDNFNTSVAPPALQKYDGSLFYLVKPSLSSTVTIDSATVDNVVINAIASAKTADFDVLTFAGEFHDTVRLFRTTVAGVSHISRRVARRAKQRVDRRILRKHIAELRSRGITWKGNLSPPPRRAQSAEYVTEFSKLWLTARYGVRPLLYDFQSIASLLNEKHANLLARKSATLTRSLSNSATSVTDLGSYILNNAITRTGNQTYRATVFYKDLQSRIGANPVITAYELTRMSFVFDWFINVGAWLKAMSPREGYTELGISVGVVTDYNEVAVSVAAPGSAYTWTPNRSNASETFTVLKYDRFAYTGVPLPSINVNLNPAKVLDLISLVITNRRRIFKILGL